MGWLGGSLNLENYGSRWKCSSNKLQKAWFTFTGQRWLNQCLQNLIAHLLPTCCLLPLLVEVPARTGDRVPERRRHFLLFRGWVAGEVGEERWLHPRVQPHTGRLSAKDRARGPKGKTADVQVNRGWLRGTQGGAQIINATGGRIWSGRRRGGAPQEPPSGTPTPF